MNKCETMLECKQIIFTLVERDITPDIDWYHQSYLYIRQGVP